MQQGWYRRNNGTAAQRDEKLDLLARLLDDVFRIPGTRIRFGLDALLGLIPGLGDAITGLASLVILFAGWRRGLPRVAMARMLVNVALDVIVGAVPLLGEVFDIAWKANRRNVGILRRYAERKSDAPAQSWRDWAFLVLLGAAALAILAVPLAVFIWLLRSTEFLT